MKEFVKEVQRIDFQIAGVQKSIEQLKSLLIQNEEGDLDINYIEKNAKGNAFKQHIISTIEKDLGYMYCCALASMLELTGDKNRKIKQLYYVFRIYYSFYNDAIAEELMRDSKLFTVDNLKNLLDGLNVDGKRNLFVDFLLMILLDGSVEEKQMEYFCEMVAFAGCNGKDIEIVGRIVKSILLMNRTELLEIVKDVDINNYFSYLGEEQSYYVVSSINEIKESKCSKILVYGDIIKNMTDVINIEEYGKEKIVFQKCCFENISGIINEITPVKFMNCKFIDCKHENVQTENNSSGGFLFGGHNCRYKKGGELLFFIDMKNVELENVIFENCCIEGYQSNSSVIRLKESGAINCKFINCKIGIYINDYLAAGTGAVLKVYDTSIENCEFENCEAYGDTTCCENFYYMRLVEAEGGQVLNNRFRDCRSENYMSYGMGTSRHTFNNYIFAFDNKCYEKSNVFENCSASQGNYRENNSEHKMKGLINKS